MEEQIPPSQLPMQQTLEGQITPEMLAEMKARAMELAIQQTVPQVSGGEDLYDNAIQAYNFLTTKVPQNYVGGNAWYTWIIPVSLTNNQRQVLIDVNTSNGPNLMTAVGTEPTINTFTFTYSGATITPTVYRVYTTYPNPIFKITDTQNIYFKGNTISP